MTDSLFGNIASDVNLDFALLLFIHKFELCSLENEPTEKEVMRKVNSVKIEKKEIKTSISNISKLHMLYNGRKYG